MTSSKSTDSFIMVVIGCFNVVVAETCCCAMCSQFVFSNCGSKAKKKRTSTFKSWRLICSTFHKKYQVLIIHMNMNYISEYYFVLNPSRMFETTQECKISSLKLHPTP